jgi:recombination protein RecT
MSELADKASGQVAARERQSRPGGGLVQAVRSMEPQFALATQDPKLAAQIARDAVTAISSTPKLQQCDQTSFLAAVMTCAQLGLRPGVMGQAYVLPYNQKNRDGSQGVPRAQLVLGYQGIVELMWRSGMVESLQARVVHEHDVFRVSYGTRPEIVHEPAQGDRGPAVAYYAVIGLRGRGVVFEVMWRGEMEAFRAKHGGQTWKDHFDAMALKTVLKRAAKWAPKTEVVGSALAVDGTVRESLDAGHLDLMVDTETGEVQ